jgi:hypothetical protein
MAARSSDCATLTKWVNLPRVRSGELVLNTRCDRPRLSVSRRFRAGDESSADIGVGLHLDECRALSPASFFGAMVSETARRVGVEPRALAVRVLLHLPRVASYEGWVPSWQVQRELRISAERLGHDMRAATGYVPFEQFALSDLAFDEVHPGRALPVLTLLHYLRSARPGSRHFALVDPVHRLPVTLCSLSPLQWKCVRNQIRSQFAISPERVWEVSRVYSIDNAPRNAISSLLSRVRRYLRRRKPSVDLLVSVVDLNLGFTGSSYRAANWQRWTTVKARPYLYDNGNYVTPRQLRERFGSSSLIELQAKYPRRFQQSRVPLLDSIIYCSNVNGGIEVVAAQHRRRLHR